MVFEVSVLLSQSVYIDYIFYCPYFVYVNQPQTARAKLCVEGCLWPQCNNYIVYTCLKIVYIEKDITDMSNNSCSKL